MAVLERYQEIGLCKAIGASDGDLFVLFLTEAGIIGFLGGLTGIGLGWLMSWGMEAAASAYAHRQGITGRLDLFAFPPGCWPSRSASPSSSAWWPAFIPPCGPRGSIRSAPCGRIEDRTESLTLFLQPGIVGKRLGDLAFLVVAAVQETR